MIVDVHTHFPSHEHAVPRQDARSETTMRSGATVQLTNSVADYLEAMAPVDKAFVFPIAPRPWKGGDFLGLGPQGWPEGMNGNDVSAAVAKHAPDKIIPFMSLHPLDPNVNDEYDRCVGDLGCKGIKMGANYQDFDPNGEGAYRLYARLEADGIPILWHTGTSPMWDAPLMYAHPQAYDRVAAAFPRLKMILAHLGHPWHIETITVVRKHPNVWADISAQFYRPWSYWNGMRLFHEWGVTEKIFFASDWPVTMPQDNIDHIRGLNKFAADHHLPGIPEQELEAIINRDAVERLGIA